MLPIPTTALADEAQIEAALAEPSTRVVSKKSMLRRLATEPRFLARAVRFAARIPTPLRSRCRFALEQIILPHYAALKNRGSMLFVGCDYYTWHYARMFRHHDYMTIDPEPKKSAFGASRHFVDGIQNIAQHVQPSSIDTVICNGVLGFGVNTLEQANASFQACRDVLRPGGELVIGWNDGPNERPFALEEVDALQSFDRIAFQPIGQEVLRVPTAYSYAYEFFAKPGLLAS